jgi:hypothetical protein
MKALGTTSSAFVNATLVQIQNASRLPGGHKASFAIADRFAKADPGNTGSPGAI